MTAFFRTLGTRRQLLGMLLLAILCFLILQFGDLLSIWRHVPLASIGRRWALVGTIVLIYVLAQVVPWLRRRRREARLLSALAREGAHVASSDEVDELTERLQDTMAFLRRAHVRRSLFTDYRYVLPWYVVIGPESAGKVSLIRSAGLRMPADDQLADGLETRVNGSGTRWWFTEEAVLISVAGRAMRDRSDPGSGDTWKGVLEFLASHRPRLPANGIIVVASVASLLGDGKAEMATAIRARLQEATRLLQTRLQVYVVVSQCDRLLGFGELFGSMDERERLASFGAVLPLQTQRKAEGPILPPLAEGISRAFEQVARLVPFRAAAERDPARRARMLGLPEQLATAGDAALRFTAELARAGRYEKAVAVRGVFFTAADVVTTGELDAWQRPFAGPMALDETAALAMPAGERPGALFINGLFRDVIFPELASAGRNIRAERTEATLHALGYAVCLLSLALVVYLSATEYVDHRATLARYETSRAGIEQLLPGGAPSELGQNFDGLLALLDRSQAMSRLDVDDTPSEREIGVSPLDISVTKIAAVESYHDMLRTFLAPALQRRLAAQLRLAVSTGGDLEAIRSLLTLYLMTNQPARFDAAAFDGWAASTLSATYPLDAASRRDAIGYLNDLMPLMPVRLPVDPALVADARSALERRPSATQLYLRLQQLAAANPATPPIDVAASLGANGAQLLMLRTQAGIPVIIPGLYTHDGFYQVFVQEAPTLARSFDAADWIMGQASTQQNTAEAGKLLQQVSDLYVRDYVRYWQGVTSQVVLRALPDLPSLVAALQTLAGPESPVTSLVQLIRRQTDLPVPAPAAPPALLQRAEAATGVSAAAGEKLAARLVPGAGDSFTGLLGSKAWPGDQIRLPFAPLQRLLDAATGQAPLLQVQGALATALAFTSGVAAANNPGLAAQQAMAKVVSSEGADPLIGLQVQAAILPQPIERMFRTLHANIWAQLSELSLAYTQTVWARDVQPECQGAFAQRYPFTRAYDAAPSSDVSISDFTSFFAPNGTLDKFVAQNLATFTTPGPLGQLSLISRNGLSLGISRTAMEQINRGRRFQAMFFNRGGTPSARFWLTPSYLDSRLISARVTAGPVSLLYQHGPPIATEFNWPPADEAANTSLQLTPVSGRTVDVSAQGPWGLFRLLQAGQVTPGASSDRATLAYKLDDYGVTFQLRANSVNNPITSTDFTAFRCVPRL